MSAGPVDTIVALATPPGAGAIAVVRVSGPGAADVLERIAPGLAAMPAEPRRARLATIVHPESGDEVDRALVTWFPGPASYTGEDVLEISGHGGRLAPLLVLEACRAAGARSAEPGEFTRRAYLAGRLDLVQAEAVADLVEGRSRALHRAALRQLEGGLSARVAAVRGDLVELEAWLVHHLDFPEEDDAPVSAERIAARAREIASGLDRLIATAPEGELLRSGALLVLAGRPNTGKSSLFNALLGEDRALVTEIAGTTRDALEAEVSIGGFPFRLVDTAGLRDGAGKVERMGIEVARRFLAAADVVLFCVEAGRVASGDEARFVREAKANGKTVLVMRTKADAAATNAVPDDDGIPVSVVTGRGLDVLRARLPELVFGGLVGLSAEAPVVTRERQAAALGRGRDEVVAFAAALAGGVPAEVASAHLRSAETALEDVLGIVTPEEVLDHLFRSFCIGK